MLKVGVKKEVTDKNWCGQIFDKITKCVCYDIGINGINMAYQSVRSEYMRIPPVTRVYTTACVLTTLAVVGI